MKEVYKNLFVGDEKDYDKNKGKVGWAYVLAAKDPYHRELLGYTSLAAPKEDPEYLVAKRGQKLVLNLVDLPPEKSKFIPDEIIEKSIAFIRSRLITDTKVLVVCNQGKSRSPSLAFAYMIKHTDTFKNVKSFSAAEKKFKEIYPEYNPSGIRDKVEALFDKDLKL